MAPAQMALFDDAPQEPEGFRYARDIVGEEEERSVAERLEQLAFAPFEFHGFTGKRRIVSFGWRYVFDGSGLTAADPIPDFLLPVRAAAAAFAGREPAEFEHVLVTEYAPGATIGWHKDRSVFGVTVGISLLSPCTFRFRRRKGAAWQRESFRVEPRSAYLLSGASRSEWEHSIPPGEGLRYSITLRTMAVTRDR